MDTVSTVRLHVLRATYLLIVVGLGLTIWPGIVRHPLDLGLMNTVVRAMLGAVALLALVGLRHPLRMVPLLLFELLWKTVWLVAFALPLAMAGRIDARTAETVRDCLVGIVVFPLAIPWPWVWRRYVTGPGTPWTRPRDEARP